MDSDNNNTKKTTRGIGRRNVLKNVAIASGIAGASSLTGGVAAGKSVKNDQSMRDMGVEDEYNDLINEGKIEEAIQLLENANVNHSTTRKKLPFRSDDSKDQPISPDDVVEKDSSIYLIANEVDDPIFSATVTCDLTARNDLLDCSGPDDAVAISYSDDRWKFNPESEDLGPYMDNFDPGPEGCVAKYDDTNLVAGFDETTHLKIELEKDEPGQHNLFGHYGHTWIPCSPGGGAATFGVSYGALSVNAGLKTDYWKEPTETVQI